MTAWFERDGGGRLAVEMDLLRRHYPQAVAVLKDGLMRVRMNVQGRKATYCLELVFPRRFPNEVPQVFMRSPKLPGSTPHYFSDDSLCLYHWPEVGMQTSAKILLDWSVMYVKAFELWQDTRRWPNPSEILNQR